MALGGDQPVFAAADMFLAVAAAPAVKSKAAVESELQAALARIALLEKTLTANGIPLP